MGGQYAPVAPLYVTHNAPYPAAPERLARGANNQQQIYILRSLEGFGRFPGVRVTACKTMITDERSALVWWIMFLSLIL